MMNEKDICLNQNSFLMKITRSYISLFVINCLIATFFLFSTPQQLHAQGKMLVQHGDWQIRCQSQPGARDPECGLVQNVTAEDRDNIGLSVIAIKTVDKKARLMRILAPLGIYLPAELGLRIDGVDIGRVGFARCLFSGCIAEVPLENALLEKIYKGKMATFIIFQTPEEGIGIPISLKGFQKGFNALK